MPVVHAELPPPNAGGVRCASVTSAWMTNGKNGRTKERKKKDSEAKRRQTQGFSAAPSGTAAPQKREARISCATEIGTVVNKTVTLINAACLKEAADGRDDQRCLSTGDEAGDDVRR